MCASLAIATTLLTAVASGGSALMTAKASSEEAKQTRFQMDMQNRQLEEEQQMMRLKTQQQEAERISQANDLRSRNMAWQAASGVDENYSYLEGIDPYNDRMLAGDLGALSLNQRYQTNRIADQIAVNRAQSAFAGTKAGLETMGGYLKAAGSIAADVRGRQRSRNFYSIGE